MNPNHSYQKFDLINALSNYGPVLEKVFSFLHPKDLRVVPCVSHTWRDICYNVTLKANRRRLKALRSLKRVKRKVGTENWPIDIKYKKKRRNESQNESNQQVQPLRRKFSEIQNVGHKNQQQTQFTPTKKKARWKLARVPFKQW